MAVVDLYAYLINAFKKVLRAIGISLDSIKAFDKIGFSIVLANLYS